jgi:hypothetical protein
MDDRYRAKTEKTAAKRNSLKGAEGSAGNRLQKGFEDWNEFRNKNVIPIQWDIIYSRKIKFGRLNQKFKFYGTIPDTYLTD